MKRREVMLAVGGGMVAWPLATRAQQPPMPVVGFVSTASPESYAVYVASFRQGLQQSGYTEGQNVAIEYRWAEGHYDRLPALAAELARIPVAVIAATGGGLSAEAAKAATQAIPIVFSSGGRDPVKAGLVASFNRPGGNLTGVKLLTVDLVPKRLELLTELLPKAVAIGLLVNPDSPDAAPDAKAVQDEAHRRGLEVHTLRASHERDFETVFATLVHQRADALLVDSDSFFASQSDRIVALAARYSIPAIYEWREFALKGGLMSYGTSLVEAYRQVGIYVGKILKGAKPAELPVVQSTKVELIINLKTAKTLGIAIPPSLFARADEVIE